MPFGEKLASALREPLVHFLLAGLAIFLFFGTFGSETNLGDRRIVVNETQVARLATQWAQTWQRAPNPDELDGLIRDHIKEEIYYREALRLGLDKDDTVVRRRMHSKMEFLATSGAETMAASDAQLQVWLDRNPARYATDPVFSFDQIYVRTDDGIDTAMTRAKAWLGKLETGARPEAIGDSISLPHSMDAAATFAIDRQFGGEFASALNALPVGRWSGPVASGFGLHLVRIRSVKASQPPRLADVRKAVENDWRDATRQKRENQAYRALLDSYRIEILRPE